jgi:O-antigen ligase
MRLDHEHPEFELTAENFGEAHNDHLQTLAVSGIPGYLIFAGALITLGALSFRRTDEDLRSRFAHALALPLAGGFAVVTLAQFPLELASTASIAIHFAALGCAWAGER